MSVFNKILVPTDFSPHSTEAIRVAGELSRLCNAPVTLLAVYAAPVIALPEGALFTSPETMAAELAETDRQLDAAIGWARDNGAVGITTVSTQGSPIDEILARAEGYDLIVMGTHGRSGIKHAIMGSIAEKVVQKAPCAVLTVHAKA